MKVFVNAFVFLMIIHPILFGLFRDVRYSLFFSAANDFVRLNQEYEREYDLSNRAVERTLLLQQERRRQRGVEDPLDSDEATKKHAEEAELCVAIATVPRASDHHYLTLLVGSLLRGSTALEIHNTRFMLVTSYPETHEEAKRLAQLDNFELVPTSHLRDHEDRAETHSLLNTMQWGKFQQQSYLDAMKACANHAKRVNASYYVVLEDDGLLANHFIDRLHAGVAPIADKTDEWFIVKLFLTDYFVGWSVDDVTLLATLPGIFGTLVAYFALHLSCKRNLKQLIFWYLYSTYIIIIILLAIGK